ncbi:MAG: TRAP transporter small permease subunit [Bdellovibrionales bacterium]|nr:TRAP transporter small permease subunit [Bdellovibrionales bacterium]
MFSLSLVSSSPITALRQILHGIVRLNAFFFTLASWLLIILILLVVGQVICRYFFSYNSMALQELEWQLFGFIITLSIAHTFDRNNHVRVDICSNHFSARLRKGIHILGFICVIAIALSLSYFGFLDVKSALAFQSPVPVDYYAHLLSTDTSFLFPILQKVEAGLRSTLLVGEGSPNPGGLEAWWIIRSSFPLGMLLLASQCFVLLAYAIFPRLRPTEDYQWI